MAFNFKLENKVLACLKNNSENKMTAREIANWILKNYPDDCNHKKNQSTAIVTPLNTESEFLNQIVAEIGARRPMIQRNNPQIKITEGRPRKYYFTEKSDNVEIEVAEAQNNNTKEKIGLSENDLYPLLAEYLFSDNQNIYSKRIDEKKSSNSKGVNGNKWLYPDMVALEDLSFDWADEIKGCVQQSGGIKASLWSFEVKLLVNRSNVREVFFQTVSNSAWANYGYLVAESIEGTDTIKELRMLSALHGVGVIHLNSENPAESQIIIPAEENEIDWNTANRLALENRDFRDCLQLVMEFYQTGKTRKALWDIP